MNSCSYSDETSRTLEQAHLQPKAPTHPRLPPKLKERSTDEHVLDSRGLVKAQTGKKLTITHITHPNVVTDALVDISAS